MRLTDLHGDTMIETLEQKQSLPRWRRILLWLVLTAMVLLAVVILASYIVGRRLGAEIVKISEAGEPLTFLDLAKANSPETPTQEDAARYYVEALMSISPASLPNLRRVNTFYRQNISSLPTNQLPNDLRDSVTQNLAVSEPIFEKFDKGAGLALSSFDIGIRQGIEVCKTRLRRVETATLLASLRTLDLILRGEDDAAADSAISMLKMMRIFDSHPTMILHTIKTGFVGLACEDVRLLLERGRPSDESLAELEKVLSETIPANVLERTFLAERVYQMEIGRNLIPEDIVSRFLQDDVPDLPERIPLPGSFLGRLRLRQKSRRYFSDMARLITTSRQFWPGPLDTIVDNGSAPAKKSSRLISIAATTVRLTAGALIAVRCTTLAVAIKRYRRGTGELPGSLDDLAPTYINSIPLDPFTGKKLLYNHDEESYVVYSAGINRADDAGSIKPKPDEKVPLDLGLRIRVGKVE